MAIAYFLSYYLPQAPVGLESAAATQEIIHHVAADHPARTAAQAMAYLHDELTSTTT